MSVPTILHADADAFFAAVEQRDDPRLRGKPTLVGSGVVMAASYEARAFGVRGGMGATKARRLCPHALVVDEPNWDAYRQASSDLFDVFRDTAPLVEGLSLEEAFLDVRGLEHISGSAPEIAHRLRERVGEEVGLAVTVGVARTKLLAKMASREAKPDGLLVIEPAGELDFLHPIPVERLWGVGAATAGKLHARDLRTVAAVAQVSQDELIALLGGSAGRHLFALAQNRDTRRVRSGRRRSSFGAQSALGRRSRTPQELQSALAALVDRVTRRMRTRGRAGRTVALRLRFGDYSHATRSRTLPHATSATGPILNAASGLLRESLGLLAERGVTLIGITVSNLDDRDSGEQLSMPLDETDTSDLDRALDGVTERFGSGAVTRATRVGRSQPHSPVRVGISNQPALISYSGARMDFVPSKRTYNDACGIARALDAVGERWGLMVVRELTLGPKRFTDIREGLPGVSPDVLAQRLRELEASGILRKRKLPPPAASQVYELTPSGEALEPVLVALGRWGGANAKPPQEGMRMSRDAHILSLRTLFEPELAGDFETSISIALGEYGYHADIQNGYIDAGPGEPAKPEITVRCEPFTLIQIVRGMRETDEAVASGDLEIEGDRKAFDRFAGLFPLPAAAAA